MCRVYIPWQVHHEAMCTQTPLVDWSDFLLNYWNENIVEIFCVVSETVCTIINKWLLTMSYTSNAWAGALKIESYHKQAHALTLSCRVCPKPQTRCAYFTTRAWSLYIWWVRGKNTHQISIYEKAHISFRTCATQHGTMYTHMAFLAGCVCS